MSSSLYSVLPETLDSRHAKEASDLQSEVPARRWGQRRETGSS